MTTPSDRPGPRLATLLAGEPLAQARRLLAKGRVEEVASFRSALAGTVVAPNGRRFGALLVCDRQRQLREARCACSPKLPPGTLCQHLVALVLATVGAPSRGPLGELELPGESFERSAWCLAAEALFEQRAAVVEVRRDGPDRGSLQDADGIALAEWEGAPPDCGPNLKALFSAPWSRDSGVLDLSGAERRLVEATETAEEAQLARRGGQSRRQAFERSPWWLLAKRIVEASAGESTAAPKVELRARQLMLSARLGETTLRLRLNAAAVTRLASAVPELLAAPSLPFAAGSVRPALRLSLAADGALWLEPVYLEERPAGVRTVAREAALACCRGPFFLVPDEEVLLPLTPGRRPFAEPESEGQAGLDLDDEYRPSVIGQPLDRRTHVPNAASARFLVRHAAEIAALPAVLVAPELAAGKPREPEEAELVVEGEEAGRFVLALVYRAGGRVVPFATILGARRRREPLLFHSGILIDPAHPGFAWMDLLAPEAVTGEGDATRLHLSALEVCRLRSHLPEGHRLVVAEGAEAAATSSSSTAPRGAAGPALARLADLAPDAPPPSPESLGIPLFEFQRAGYAWLWFLWRNGFGGLLCDDMGLGKTYQAIALLAAIAASSDVPPRVLVVCPASVLPHWREKLALLVPSLSLRLHYGAERDTAPISDGVVLTTYGTLRNDAEALEATPFDLFVLDEIQTVKNRDSATHQALRRLTARVSLGLTGTPIENQVEELRTVLDFVLPGYLPGPAAFDRLFGQPIAAGDAGARRRLRRLVRPFVMRRTKSQVLAGLPPKIEDRRRCVMTPEQEAVYRRLLLGPGAEMRRALDGSGRVPYLHVFALLSRLKQACDHPDLLRPPGASPSGAGSGKWNLLVEILDEALGSGLKVVVFSQYLRMLDLITVHLEERGIGFTTLRGETTDRARPVRRFREEEDCRVFLASLRAGGLGIDLTPASVVVHYDRWWNQAREDQATDRVHRIGQRRGVQVLTLITEGTIEERIDQLIRDKGRLAADLVPEDDARLRERFTREELRALLAP